MFAVRNTYEKFADPKEWDECGNLGLANCSKFASCVEDNDLYPDGRHRCVCHRGYYGNGTYCAPA